jgi:hypothetical protein
LTFGIYDAINRIKCRVKLWWLYRLSSNWNWSTLF